MSNPKEKAEELIDRMWLSSNAQDGAWMDSELAKQCALIAVDEILSLGKKISLEMLEYYLGVKKEIEKL